MPFVVELARLVNAEPYLGKKPMYMILQPPGVRTRVYYDKMPERKSNLQAFLYIEEIQSWTPNIIKFVDSWLSGNCIAGCVLYRPRVDGCLTRPHASCRPASSWGAFRKLQSPAAVAAGLSKRDSSFSQ